MRYTSASGVITSPRYPRPYGPSLECTFVVSLPRAEQQVLLSVDAFDVEWSPNCSKDWVELRQGGDLSSPLLGRYP